MKRKIDSMRSIRKSIAQAELFRKFFSDIKRRESDKNKTLRIENMWVQMGEKYYRIVK